MPGTPAVPGIFFSALSPVTQDNCHVHFGARSGMMATHEPPAGGSDSFRLCIRHARLLRRSRAAAWFTEWIQ
jgi:hypothetical protein